MRKISQEQITLYYTVWQYFINENTIERQCRQVLRNNDVVTASTKSLKNQSYTIAFELTFRNSAYTT